MRLCLALLACLCALIAPAAVGAGTPVRGIVVSDAWMRATPPGASVAAGYLVIANGTSREDELLAVSTPAAARIEMHSSSVKDGIMRMRMLTSVRVAPRATVRFEPGGLHLMFIELRAPLVAGATVPVTLRFRRAGAVPVRLEVRALSGG